MQFESPSSFALGAPLAAAGPSVRLAPAAALRTVDVTAAAAWQNGGALLLDVREPHEYAQLHAPGSLLIPLGQIERRLQEISRDKDRPVALICRSGKRSFEAQKYLASVGFSSTANVEGGMIAWQNAGLPVAALS